MREYCTCSMVGTKFCIETCNHHLITGQKHPRDRRNTRAEQLGGSGKMDRVKE